MVALDDLAIVILAAGNSSRMGRSKQLMKVDNQTLLERAVGVAIGSGIPNIVVVLGANADELQKLLNKSTVQCVINAEWSLGMGGSIRTGVRHVLGFNYKIEGILFMTCDQPEVSSDHIKAMADIFINECPTAVASQYGDSYGIPALFDRMVFSSLLSIYDRSGAHEVLERFHRDLRLLPLKGGEIDIDTPEDFEEFLKSRSKV